jgi:hypothetical protein
VIFVILLIGGFFRSLQFTSINAIAYADVETRRTSAATALVAVAQQLSISSGVAVGALVVEWSMRLSGHATLTAADFPSAFLVVAGLSAASTLIFLRLSRDAGDELAARLPAVAKPSDQRAA